MGSAYLVAVFSYVQRALFEKEPCFCGDKIIQNYKIKYNLQYAEKTIYV
jgi:hypothetical protein